MKTKIDVPHIAKLANLSINDEEVHLFEKQLSNVLSYVEKLNEVNTEGLEETSRETTFENVKREDTAQASLTQEEALSNAPKKHNGRFVVKGLLEENE